MSVTVITTFRASQERLPGFTELMRKFSSALPGVKGCEGVHVFHGLDEPFTFTLVETWRSREHHDDHMVKITDAGEWDHILTHLAADPDTAYYEKMWS